MIHLDTSFLVDLMREARREKIGPATRLLTELAEEPLVISIFVLCELRSGAVRSNDPEAELRRVDAVVNKLGLSLPDRRFAVTYADLVTDLYTRRLNVDTMDLLIACSAVLDEARLVTRNTRHFSLIPDLRILGYD